MKKPLSRVGEPTMPANIGDADDYAEEAASPCTGWLDPMTTTRFATRSPQRTVSTTARTSAT
jgi:hypothetical protein